MLARDAAAGDLDADAAARRLLIARQRGLADEVVLVHLDRPAKARFKGGNGIVHLMAVEGHGGLQPQRVARAQAAGNQPVVLPRLQERVPQGGRVGIGAVELEAVLAGVACARDEALDPRHRHLRDERIVARGRLLIADLGKDGPGLGALQGELGHVVAHVGQLAVAKEVFAHPAYVLVAVGRVDHHPVCILGKAVDDQIIHHAALGIAHHAVAHLAVAHGGKVVGEQLLQICQGSGSLVEHLAHVADVKQAAGLTHGHVLADHARGILHRQHVAREGHHAPFQRHVAVIQRRLELHCHSPF